jgi:hypothetical protein
MMTAGRFWPLCGVGLESETERSFGRSFFSRVLMRGMVTVDGMGVHRLQHSARSFAQLVRQVHSSIERRLAE